MRFRLIRVCKGEAMSAIPQDVIRYDLKGSIPALRDSGYEVEDKEIMLLANREGVEVTIYVNGRLMLSPMTEKERAKALSEHVYGLLRPEDES